jgi:hypothetical protein
MAIDSRLSRLLRVVEEPSNRSESQNVPAMEELGFEFVGFLVFGNWILDFVNGSPNFRAA